MYQNKNISKKNENHPIDKISIFIIQKLSFKVKIICHCEERSNPESIVIDCFVVASSQWQKLY